MDRNCPAKQPNYGLHELVGDKAGQWAVLPLSAEMAIRFEKAFGVKADTLMRMQTAHDLAKARAQSDHIVVDEVLLTA